MAIDLDIDHILPQNWCSHWTLANGQTVSGQEVSDARLLAYTATELGEKNKAIIARERAVPAFGNLTLVHYGVNRSVQHREFGVKRKALFEHSNLQLNRSLTMANDWDEAAILARGEVLYRLAKDIWRGPA